MTAELELYKCKCPRARGALQVRHVTRSHHPDVNIESEYRVLCVRNADENVRNANLAPVRSALALRFICTLANSVRRVRCVR